MGVLDQIPADEPDRTAWQFNQAAGTEADRIAHYSVWIEDSDHRDYCATCRDLDNTIGG